MRRSSGEVEEGEDGGIKQLEESERTSEMRCMRWSRKVEVEEKCRRV